MFSGMKVTALSKGSSWYFITLTDENNNDVKLQIKEDSPFAPLLRTFIGDTVTVEINTVVGNNIRLIK